MNVKVRYVLPTDELVDVEVKDALETGIFGGLYFVKVKDGAHRFGIHSVIEIVETA